MKVILFLKMDGYESDTYISDELVDAGESLFCLDAGL